MRAHRLVLGSAILAFALGATPALAQSAGSAGGSAPSAAPGGGGTVSPANPAPSGGVATGRSAAGPQTRIQKKEQRKQDRDMSICKGC